MPHEPQAIEDIHAEFLSSILPYGSGNLHPRFMGWVQGAGTVPGMLAEMLAAGLNANLGGRDHSGIEVERQLVQWVREMFGFPDGASGIFVTGTSMANFMAGAGRPHRSVGDQRAPVGSGLQPLARLHLGRGAWLRAARLRLRRVGLGRADGNRRRSGAKIDIAELKARIRADRAAGLEPFMVIASAGTVDAGRDRRS